MTIAILGAGAFGTALAVSLSQNEDVIVWGRDPDAIKAIQQTRETPRLPGIQLNPKIQFSAEIESILASDIVLLAVPAQTIDSFVAANAAVLSGKHLVCCAKGINLHTMKGAAATASDALGGQDVAVLTGPSFAADIARGLPTALTLASTDDETGRHLQSRLSTQTIRLYRTTDLIGAELGGALKNVMAIACGAAIGFGLGESARAALMTRGFAEMQRLAICHGARPETLMGLSGLGDLSLTCNSDLSRNFRFGYSLGQGGTFDPATTIEGAATAKAVVKVAKALDIDAPISQVVAKLVDNSITVQAALDLLLSRPLKEE